MSFRRDQLPQIHEYDDAHYNEKGSISLTNEGNHYRMEKISNREGKNYVFIFNNLKEASAIYKKEIGYYMAAGWR